MALNIALAQINCLVGDIRFNSNKIIQAAEYSREQLKADVVVFSELSITGYPPEDLLLRSDFIEQVENAILTIARQVSDIHLVIGSPERLNGKLFNSALVLHNGSIVARYRKNILPNYGVFDEKRYFNSAHEISIFSLHNTRFGLTICEDIWQSDVVEEYRKAGADILLTLNASPFHSGKIIERENIVRERVAVSGIPLVYVNQVGGQDELVFDGASFVVDQQGEVVFRAEEFKEQTRVVEFINKKPLKGFCAPLYAEISSDYQALVLGIRDYVNKNSFQGAILGLSGGIDSALVLALAVDALGKDKVVAVLMPSRYTQGMSNEDAEAQATALGVKYHIIPIESAVNNFDKLLEGVFTGTEKDATEENIQARCRGIILMAISNKQRRILLTTGNKSEMSVGYATLYGDMAGGFAPIKDVPKLLVYQLAQYRNSLSQVIPERVITRPPSAELAPDQIDEDSLPAYSVLDPILEMYVEQDQSVETIIKSGFPRDDVLTAITLVDRNEYKRRQAPPGIRITPRAFGRDRRYPITSGFKGGDI